MFVGQAASICAQDLNLTLFRESLLVFLRESYVAQGPKPRKASCKESSISVPYLLKVIGSGPIFFNISWKHEPCEIIGQLEPVFLLKPCIFFFLSRWCSPGLAQKLFPALC